MLIGTGLVGIYGALRRHPLATLPVPADRTSGFGIMKTDVEGRIVHFEEKPKAERLPDLVSPLPGGRGDAWLAKKRTKGRGAI